MLSIIPALTFGAIAAAGLFGMWRLGDTFVRWSVQAYGPLETQGQEWDAAHGAAGVAIDQDAAPAMQSPERIMQ